MSAADRLQRDFTAKRPNAAWVADFTYVAAWCGVVYVAFVVDVHSRAIVGWAASLTADRPDPPAVSCPRDDPRRRVDRLRSRAWHKPVITFRDSLARLLHQRPSLARRRTTPQWQSGPAVHACSMDRPVRLVPAKSISTGPDVFGASDARGSPSTMPPGLLTGGLMVGAGEVEGTGGTDRVWRHGDVTRSPRPPDPCHLFQIPVTRHELGQPVTRRNRNARSPNEGARTGGARRVRPWR